MFELIFSKKAFMAIKEKMDRTKYVSEGEKETLNMKPKAPAVPTSQKTDKAIGGKFVEDGETEKLLYPKVKKESAMDPKSAAQQLPGSEKIDAAGKQFIDGGQTEKLQFPSKAGPDPKIKMQGLDVSNDAKKSIDGGEMGGIKHGPNAGPKIKIDWQVNTDTAIGGKFQERGDKGDAKSVSAPAKEPGVSMQKDNGADAFIERGEEAKPIQKQFSLNFRKSTLAEKDSAMTEAVENSILELEVAASKCGVNLQDTKLAATYTSLLAMREGVKKHGSLFVTTVEKPVAPIVVQASAKPAIDEDKAAMEVGARIF